MCNDRLPAKETKKDQVVFRKDFREHFHAMGKIQKIIK